MPDLAALPGDQPDYYDWPCRQTGRDGPGTDEVLICEDPDPPAEPNATILIAGGSHAGMWTPAFRQLAAQHNWEILVADKSGCQLATPVPWQAESCVGWNENFVAAAVDRDPDLVFTIASTTIGNSGVEHLPEEFVEKWREIGEAGLPVVAVRGTARMPALAPECLERTEFALQECGRERGSVFEADPPWQGRDLPDSAATIDLLDRVCGPQWCLPVVGNVVVYRDHSHLSTRYAVSLAPMLDDGLREAAPYLYP